jgi:uncharacterized protein (DUF3084 family)
VKHEEKMRKDEEIRRILKENKEIDEEIKRKDEEIRRIIKEDKKKDEEIKRKDEEIRRIIKENKEKDEEIKRKDEKIKRKDEEIKRKDEEVKRKDEKIKSFMKEKNELKRRDKIYKINKAAWPDFVGEGFEIENGVLGLDRDCYLSIIKFLHSSILRKV